MFAVTISYAEFVGVVGAGGKILFDVVIWGSDVIC